MGYLSGLLRRLLGGWLSTKEIISERGIQWLLCFILFSPVIYFKDAPQYMSWMPHWLFVILGALSVIWYLTKGHFPSFLCGTESLEYINEQLANGREIPYRWFPDWLMNKRGFDEYGKEWCFWHLAFIKTLYAIVPALFFGAQFVFIGFLVAALYNAMFWVSMKPYKNILTSPTNWGEFWQGYLVMWGLLLA